MDGNTKRFMTNQLIWIAIYFGIAVAATLLLDFPLSFLVVMAAIIPLALYRRRLLKLIGQGSSVFGGGISSPGVSYYYMNCGTKHGQASCPNCESKLKKAGF